MNNLFRAKWLSSTYVPFIKSVVSFSLFDISKTALSMINLNNGKNVLYFQKKRRDMKYFMILNYIIPQHGCFGISCDVTTNTKTFSGYQQLIRNIQRPKKNRSNKLQQISCNKCSKLCQNTKNYFPRSFLPRQWQNKNCSGHLQCTAIFQK